MLDQTKGNVSAYVGPRSSTLSPTDRLVEWTAGGFMRVDDPERATQSFLVAAQGQYIVLSDPAADGEERFPGEGQISPSTTLDVGKRIVIPGPATFPLWPGQSAEVIDGHRLRHNQYLVVRVYEPEAARENAGRAQIEPSGEGEGDAGAAIGTDLTMGQLIVIRGTDVSFYVPPTGIEVVPEGPGEFVREAATLEQLEYTVLRDKNGSKRFERGPAVVFPDPTERFVTDRDGKRKFRAIELNPQSGLYIKVIEPYAEDGDRHEAGEELFLTGETTPIYFPRAQHSIIQYGDKRKHHAVAIPEGEGRYVLNRNTGDVDLVLGPAMFLPDPRSWVIVRRILDPKVIEFMYPGNAEALEVNRRLEEERQRLRGKSRRAGGMQEEEVGPDYLTASTAAQANLMAATLDVAVPEQQATPSTQFGGERVRRGTEYTPPRTITLDTKYEGAVAVNVWPGYAVLVMDKSGNRRVEQGPVSILLQYTEALMVLSLSQGRPKTDKAQLRTPYLRVVNNSVSDQLTVETRDLVPVTLELALRVNFEGEDPTKWFDVEDYVALLTDHCRSKLRNLAKRHDVQSFYTSTIDLIRDTLLGEASDDEPGGRPGLPFRENGMRLYDVEVLAVRIEDESVGGLLTEAMDTALRGAIRLSEARQTTERDAQLEELKRRQIEEREKTYDRESEAEVEQVVREEAQLVRRLAMELRGLVAQREQQALQREELGAATEQELALQRERNDVELDRLRAEVEQTVARFKAIDPALVQAIREFGDETFVEKLVEAVGPVALSTGVTTADTFRQIFKDTPFEGIMDALSERPFALANGAERRDN